MDRAVRTCAVFRVSVSAPSRTTHKSGGGTVHSGSSPARSAEQSRHAVAFWGREGASAVSSVGAEVWLPARQLTRSGRPSRRRPAPPGLDDAARRVPRGRRSPAELWRSRRSWTRVGPPRRRSSEYAGPSCFVRLSDRRRASGLISGSRPVDSKCGPLPAVGAVCGLQACEWLNVITRRRERRCSFSYRSCALEVDGGTRRSPVEFLGSLRSCINGP